MHQTNRCNSRSGWFIRVSSRDRRLAVLLLTAGVVATGALWWWKPIAWLPACPTKTYLGLYCPGCGSLRATHRVLTGQVSEALRYNILLVTVGVPLAAWFWSEQFAVLLTGHRFRSPVRAPWVAWTLLAVLLLFAVLRNIPGDVFAILRPPG